MKFIQKFKIKRETADNFNNFMRKKMILSLTVIVLLIMGIVTTSYALFFDVKETTSDTITVKDLEITYTEGTNQITRENEEPLSDELGNNTDPYSITIKNTGGLSASCEVLISDDTSYIESISRTKTPDADMRYSLNKNNIGSVSDLNGTLKTFELLPGESVEYHIRFWLKDDVSNEAVNTVFSKKIQVRANYYPRNKSSLNRQIFDNNTLVDYPTTGPGRVVATTNEGLIKGGIDATGGPTYYFRGAVTNNYVSFANKTWRIIRVNGDGSVRMILDTETGTSAYNTNYTANNLEEAISYGEYSASTIKPVVDTWYDNNISTENNSKVIVSKYCNDLSYEEDSSGDGYNFGNKSRLINIATAAPIFSCPYTNDLYNLSVGLLTADEVAFAGGIWYQSNGTSNNTSFYLYKSDGGIVATMSPSFFNINNNVVFLNMLANVQNGYIGNNLNYLNKGFSESFSVRPVISLSADTECTTASETNPGTSSNPYEC